jgi:hypothetical protein
MKELTSSLYTLSSMKKFKWRKEFSIFYWKLLFFVLLVWRHFLINGNFLNGRFKLQKGELEIICYNDYSAITFIVFVRIKNVIYFCNHRYWHSYRIISKWFWFGLCKLKLTISRRVNPFLQNYSINFIFIERLKRFFSIQLCTKNRQN